MQEIHKIHFDLQSRTAWRTSNLGFGLTVLFHVDVLIGLQCRDMVIGKLDAKQSCQE